MTIDEYSVMSLYLEMYIDGASVPLAIGTGFSILEAGQHYIITNWHNVTGRHPITNQPLSSHNICDPEIMKIWFFTKTIGHWLRKSLRLRIDGKKTWIEHPRGQNVDVVAIPYTPSDDIFVRNLDVNTSKNKLKIYPSRSVSIIGYPYGLTSGGKFPIWKKGHIASEYDLDFDNQPVFLIDATTRNGMSGSPVIVRDSGLAEFEGNRLSGGTHTRFLGVYSGRIDEHSEIGRVWKPQVISEILNKVSSSTLQTAQDLA